jgi:hypothetical protein
MELKQEAINELRFILAKEIGGEINEFSDEALSLLGTRFLKLTALSLKRKAVESRALTACGEQSGVLDPEAGGKVGAPVSLPLDAN